jgi:hypothetical protein
MVPKKPRQRVNNEHHARTFISVGRAIWLALIFFAADLVGAPYWISL